jgi:hypothetical protein
VTMGAAVDVPAAIAGTGEATQSAEHS